jgi:hypothetical protein
MAGPGTRPPETPRTYHDVERSTEPGWRSTPDACTSFWITNHWILTSSTTYNMRLDQKKPRLDPDLALPEGL